MNQGDTAAVKRENAEEYHDALPHNMQRFNSCGRIWLNYALPHNINV